MISTILRPIERQYFLPRRPDLRRAGYASMNGMSPVPGNPVLPAEPPRVNDYDTLAEAYTASNDVSLFNAYYERPATPLPLTSVGYVR